MSEKPGKFMNVRVYDDQNASDDDQEPLYERLRALEPTIFTVRYHRHGHEDVTEPFDSFDAACRWIEAMEDAGEIFATAIEDEHGPLWTSDQPHPPRWERAREDAPALPASLS